MGSQNFELLSDRQRWIAGIPTGSRHIQRFILANRNPPLTPFAASDMLSSAEGVEFYPLSSVEAGMNLLRSAFLCAAVIGLAGASAARADDQPAQSNGQATTQPSPAIHCEGENCLPPADDPVLDCKGADCTPAPPADQTPAPEIQKVK